MLHDIESSLISFATSCRRIGDVALTRVNSASVFTQWLLVIQLASVPLERTVPRIATLGPPELDPRTVSAHVSKAAWRLRREECDDVFSHVGP